MSHLSYRQCQCHCQQQHRRPATIATTVSIISINTTLTCLKITHATRCSLPSHSLRLCTFSWYDLHKPAIGLFWMDRKLCSLSLHRIDDDSDRRWCAGEEMPCWILMMTSRQARRLWLIIVTTIASYVVFPYPGRLISALVSLAIGGILIYLNFQKLLAAGIGGWYFRICW